MQTMNSLFLLPALALIGSGAAAILIYALSYKKGELSGVNLRVIMIMVALIPAATPIPLSNSLVGEIPSPFL
jgi:iron complex transport system permease protein